MEKAGLLNHEGGARLIQDAAAYCISRLRHQAKGEVSYSLLHFMGLEGFWFIAVFYPQKILPCFSYFFSLCPRIVKPTHIIKQQKKNPDYFFYFLVYLRLWGCTLAHVFQLFATTTKARDVFVQKQSIHTHPPTPQMKAEWLTSPSGWKILRNSWNNMRITKTEEPK